MKTLRNILILWLIAVAGMSTVNAQTTKKDKQAAKELSVENMVNERHYTFEATYVLPQRGSGKILTSDYDLRVTKDSLICFLPYFGRLYFDPPINQNDGGIKFTSTKFSYDVKDKKKGGWEILIKTTDVKNLDQIRLNISVDGYATLSVASTNRDFITFDGYIKENSKK